MNAHLTSRARSSFFGFSVVEMIITVAVLGTLATIAIGVMGSTHSNVKKAKLTSDVQKLNSIVAVYLGEGGSLAGLTDPDDVIDQLKTIRTTTDTKQNVGVMTGQGVDARLSVVMQSSAEAASSDPRALWDSTNNKFYISTTSGTAGVRNFDLDDTFMLTDYGNDANRAQSNVKYNANDGWVWANGNNSALPAVNPYDATTSTFPFQYDPTASVNGSGGNGVSVTTLATPSISPGSGSFYFAAFPGTATILAGPVPENASVLNYNIIRANGTSTGWVAYPGPVSLTYGDTLQAKNITTNSTFYGDSSVVSCTYQLIPTPLPSPVFSPPGGLYLASTWPNVSVDSNGAPGASSKISYQIIHSDGTSTAWSNYSSALSLYYGDQVIAKNVSTNTAMYADSPTSTATYNFTGSTQLPAPILADTFNSAGKRVITITPDESKFPMPAGYRIYYTTNGTDPGVKSTEDPVSGTLYDPTKAVLVPATNSAMAFEVIARVYPPTADKAHWDTSDAEHIDINLDVAPSPGLAYGRIDVDTSHLIYPIGRGSTDGHVHAYDDKFNVAYVNMMNILATGLRNIQAVIPNGVRFKLIVSNSNLSPGGLLTVNNTFDINNSATYTAVGPYSNIAFASLPVYSIDGCSGSTKLTKLSMNFASNALNVNGVMGSVTGWVRGNKPGRYGEARNGALTLQAVKVNADGSNAFTTSTALSSGGVQGFATSGLLWECTIFYHWNGGPYQ